MDCKADKRPVTDGPLPVGHLDIFLFLSSAHLQKSSSRTVNEKRTKGHSPNQINQSLKVALRHYVSPYVMSVIFAS